MASKIDYRVFWQALLLAVTFMILGLYLGTSLEQGRSTEVNNYYIESEVLLIDTFALNELLDSEIVSCEELRSANTDLLDRVYSEAQLLDDYEAAGRVSESIESLHKKYDVLRGYLWINAIKIKEKCGDFNTIVYFYNYGEQDLTKKAEQNVWSKILSEIKEEEGENVVLIPIAADTKLESLDGLLEAYNVKTFPSIVVNEKDVVDVIVEKEYILGLLK